MYELNVRDYLCSTDKDYNPTKSKAALRLYIKATDDCQAECKFYANEECKDFGTSFL